MLDLILQSMPILSVMPTSLIMFKRGWAFRACTIWIIWQTTITTTRGTRMIIISTIWRVRVVSITTRRTIWTSTPTTTILFCRAVRVSLIAIRGCLMQITTSMFSVISRGTVSLLRISLWSVLSRTSMNSMRNFFRINIYMVNSEVFLSRSWN